MEWVRPLFLLALLIPALAAAWLDAVAIPVWIPALLCLVHLLIWLGFRTRSAPFFSLRSPTPALFIVAGIILVSLINPSHRYAQTLHDQGPDKESVKQFTPRAEHLVAFPGTVDEEKTTKKALHLFYAISLCAALFSLCKGHRRQAYLLCWIILLNGALVGLVAIYFKLNGNGLVLGRIEPVNPRFYGPFRYHNFWASWNFLTLGLGVSLLFQALHDRRIGASLLAGAASLILMLTTFESPSRSAFLLLALFLCYLALETMLYSLRKLGMVKADRVSGRKMLFLTMGLPAAVGLLTLLLIVTTWHHWATPEFAEKQSGRMKETILQLSTLREGRLPDLRPATARDCLKMAIAKPVWGWGLGSFEYAFPLFAGPEFMDNRFQRQTKNFGRLIHPRHAHNDWAQYWAELGTVGFAALLWAIFQFLRPALTSLCILRPFSPARSLIAGVAITGILALWDFPLNNLANLALLAVVLALSVSLYPKPDPSSPAIAGDRPTLGAHTPENGQAPQPKKRLEHFPAKDKAYRHDREPRQRPSRV